MNWRDILKVWLPVLLLATVLAVLYALFEKRYGRLNDVSVQVAQIQERQKVLTRYLQLLVDAETGQRGFLLTDRAEYLQPMLEALPHLDDMLRQLGMSYARDGISHPNPAVRLAQLTTQRL